MERGYTLWPNYAFVVMAGLNDSAYKTAHTNAMATHMDRHFLAFRILHGRPHSFGIFGAKVKDLAYLDAPCNFAALLWNLGK